MVLLQQRVPTGVFVSEGAHWCFWTGGCPLVFLQQRVPIGVLAAERAHLCSCSRRCRLREGLKIDPLGARRDIEKNWASSHSCRKVYPTPAGKHLPATLQLPRTRGPQLRAPKCAGCCGGIVPKSTHVLSVTSPTTLRVAHTYHFWLVRHLRPRQHTRHLVDEPPRMWGQVSLLAIHIAPVEIERAVDKDT